jgi:hypothetical protein
VKFFLAGWTKNKNEDIKLKTLTAVMKDSFSDTSITSSTLLFLLITSYTSLPVDELVSPGCLGSACGQEYYLSGKT